MVLQYVAVARVLFRENAQADNAVFYLHYRVTCVIFLVSSLLVTAKSYFGLIIGCIGKGMPTHVLDTYCYFTSTFSMTNHWNATMSRRPESLPYPGVGIADPNNKENIVHHHYYQWVTFMLCFQAFMFYFPYYIWKSLEGGKFRTILGGLNKFTTDPIEKAKKHKLLVRYMMTNLNMHKMWSIRFFVCEALNLVNVVGNIYFTDYFLGGTFLSYGTEVMNFPEIDPENRVDPMTRIFPKLAKCTFRKFGASGTLEVIDSMCILPINIINEKIYIFIWFWLIILAVVTGLWLIYRLATLVSSSLRHRLLLVRGRMAGRPLNIISEKCDIGDWFLLYQLGCHMEASVYGEFLNEFTKELESSLATLERKPMLLAN